MSEISKDGLCHAKKDHYECTVIYEMLIANLWNQGQDLDLYSIFFKNMNIFLSPGWASKVKTNGLKI